MNEGSPHQGRTRTDVIGKRYVLGTLHFHRAGERHARRIVETFLSSGGSWIDTAWFYGSGRTEKLLGDALASARPTHVELSTKVGHFSDPASYRSPVQIRKAIDAAIDRLRQVPKTIALHEGDWACWWHRKAPVGVLVDNMQISRNSPAWSTLTDAASTYGFTPAVTGNNAEPLRRVAMAIECAHVMVAKQNDIVWGAAEQLLDWAHSAKAVVWSAAPYHQGALLDLRGFATQLRREGDGELALRVDAVGQVLSAYGLDAVSAAVPFVLHDERVAAVCVGVRSVQELLDSLSTAVLRLPAAMVQTIRELRAEKPPRPGIAHGPRYC